MAKPFQRKLPMSAALRPGGQGTVPPEQSTEGREVFNIGAMKPPGGTRAPSGPTVIGKGVKMPKVPSPPKLPAAPKTQKMPTTPKMPKFK